ncbi:hypothetical protein ACSFBF_14675 [Variovorax sp. ZT5P49]|uniref:hypothetical protein n=1 Tax=Variovorax sp. ZT5P49 TaxID=3443733 RepID=UPI003F45D343
MRRPALTVLVLAVVAMHAAVLWLLLVATQPHGRKTVPVKRMVMEVVQVEAPAKAEPPRTTTTATRATTTRMPRAARGKATTAPAAPATESPQTTTSPAPLILHSESTRRALRDIGRERSFADRAGQDLNGSPRSAFDSRLSAGVASSAHGDCMKGQFKGSNMGLLSLPALALAAAQGECGR